MKATFSKQGCIISAILPFRMGARGASSEHVENMEMFPVLQLRCALVLRELNQIFTACLFKGSQKQSFFPSNTLIYGISRDGSKNFNIRTCEHIILGRLRMGARQAKNAPLFDTLPNVQCSVNCGFGAKNIFLTEDH